MATHYEEGRGYRYDFRLYGHRYRSEGFRTKTLCGKAEQALRDRLVEAKHGIPSSRPRESYSFTEWAGVTLQYATDREHLSDPDTLDRMLKRMLLFWGDEPEDETKIVRGAPYHGLTLDAPIRDGSWLLKFEEWMSKQGIAGSTKNHYRSACSKLYRVAMLAEYRTQTGITMNPFRGILRDRPVRRTTVFTTAQLQRVLSHATPMLTLAIRIASFAPELRLGNIAKLIWKQIDEDVHWIQIADHKTARRTKRPLVTPIVPTLRRYLQQAKKQQPKGTKTVLLEDGQPVQLRQIQRALKTACKAAGLTYGMGEGGVTFHTLRHTAATLMAEIGIPDSQRQEAIGHSSGLTTAGYTHLRPRHKIEPLERLARHLGPALKSRENETQLPRISPRAAKARNRARPQDERKQA